MKAISIAIATSHNFVPVKRLPISVPIAIKLSSVLNLSGYHWRISKNVTKGTTKLKSAAIVKFDKLGFNLKRGDCKYMSMQILWSLLTVSAHDSSDLLDPVLKGKYVCI